MEPWAIGLGTKAVSYGEPELENAGLRSAFL